MTETGPVQPTEPLEQFTRLRSSVRVAAKDALKRTCPEYVDTFEAQLAKSGDFEHASRAAGPALGGGLPGAWRELLRLTVDFELALDQCKRSLRLLNEAPPESWSGGAWAVYHQDHWILNFYAWLDRLDALVARVCRMLIKPRAGGRQVEQRLRPRVDEIRVRVAKLRHPLAHTGQGGVAEGIDNMRLWEP